MGYDIKHIKGMRSVFRKKLNLADITDVDKLISACKTKEGRLALAGITGISANYLLTFAKRAEILKLDGVSQDYYTLLQEVGIESLEDLSQVQPKLLSDEIKNVNNQKKITNLPPEHFLVEDWIEKAQNNRSSIES